MSITHKERRKKGKTVCSRRERPKTIGRRRRHEDTGSVVTLRGIVMTSSSRRELIDTERLVNKGRCWVGERVGKSSRLIRLYGFDRKIAAQGASIILPFDDSDFTAGKYYQCSIKIEKNERVCWIFRKNF